ncbi:hypothetical protein FALBO_6446 [Fusarium albosuccineum]|uniref:Uncharacterized protein n=1 Tax=Fusarium albosuccineum TaxID=1237068 RepID=A0A8H4PDD4_9HYPO|nr:hypothetical protein FALBO_6446 [Fusarium albosuccineum]
METFGQNMCPDSCLRDAFPEEYERFWRRLGQDISDSEVEGHASDSMGSAPMQGESSEDELQPVRPSPWDETYQGENLFGNSPDLGEEPASSTETTSAMATSPAVSYSAEDNSVGELPTPEQVLADALRASSPMGDELMGNESVGNSLTINEPLADTVEASNPVDNSTTGDNDLEDLYNFPPPPAENSLAGMSIDFDMGNLSVGNSLANNQPLADNDMASNPVDNSVTGNNGTDDMSTPLPLLAENGLASTPTANPPLGDLSAVNNTFTNTQLADNFTATSNPVGNTTTGNDGMNDMPIPFPLLADNGMVSTPNTGNWGNLTADMSMGNMSMSNFGMAGQVPAVNNTATALPSSDFIGGNFMPNPPMGNNAMGGVVMDNLTMTNAPLASNMSIQDTSMVGNLATGDMSNGHICNNFIPTNFGGNYSMDTPLNYMGGNPIMGWNQPNQIPASTQLAYNTMNNGYAPNSSVVQNNFPGQQLANPFLGTRAQGSNLMGPASINVPPARRRQQIFQQEMAQLHRENDLVAPAQPAGNPVPSNVGNGGPSRPPVLSFLRGSNLASQMRSRSEFNRGGSRYNEGEWLCETCRKSRVRMGHRLEMHPEMTGKKKRQECEDCDRKVKRRTCGFYVRLP